MNKTVESIEIFLFNVQNVEFDVDFNVQNVDNKNNLCTICRNYVL